MSFWRAAGLNYVQYSNVAARCVRAALKKDLQVNSRTQRYSYCYIFSLSVGFLDSEPKDPKHVAGSGSEFFFESGSAKYPDLIPIISGSGSVKKRPKTGVKL